MLDVENLEKWEDVHQVKSFCPEFFILATEMVLLLLYITPFCGMLCVSGSDQRPH